MGGQIRGLSVFCARDDTIANLITFLLISLTELERGFVVYNITKAAEFMLACPAFSMGL
jgi:hypothetical protein